MAGVLRSRVARRTFVAGLVVAFLITGWVGWGFLTKIQRWRHLDASYVESFAAPEVLAATLNGRSMLFHVKTGLDQDDSQICVGFNVVWAALRAGASVTVLIDAGALLDVIGEQSRLHDTGVPLRLRKVIAAQLGVPLDEVPADYGAYLEVLHEAGAEVYANTAMLVVTGDAENVDRGLPAFPFVEPAPYATVARLLADAETVVVY